MKKHVKIIINIMLTFLIIYTFMPSTFATETKLAASGSGTIQGIVGGAGNFLNLGIGSNTNVIDENALEEGSSTLYNILLVIGIAVAIIWGLVLGIQFITGSIIDKAEIEKALVPYVIGCVIIFGAFAIWRLVINLLQPLST